MFRAAPLPCGADAFRWLVSALLLMLLASGEACSGPAAPQPFEVSRILVIGDSISLGQGANGKGPNCALSPASNREDLAYGAILAKELDADLTVLALGGHGLVRNYDDIGEETIQAWLGYPEYSRLPPSDPAPDLVLLHVGTNDFYQHDAGEAFEAAYTDLAGHILSVYPNARLIALMGPMLDQQDRSRAISRIQSALQALPAADRSRVDLTTFDPANYPNAGLGCAWHPSARMQKAMADAIMARFVLR